MTTFNRQQEVILEWSYIWSARAQLIKIDENWNQAAAQAINNKLLTTYRNHQIRNIPNFLEFRVSDKFGKNYKFKASLNKTSFKNQDVECRQETALELKKT